MSKQLADGFTLIEVLIAILILSIASFAVFHTMQSSIQIQAKLQHKLEAHWVLMNQLSLVEVGELAIPKGQSSIQGKITQLNYNWVFNVQQNNQLFTVSVYDNKSNLIDSGSIMIPLPDGGGSS